MSFLSLNDFSFPFRDGLTSSRPVSFFLLQGLSNMDIIELSDDDSVKEQVVIDLLGDSDGESGGASTSTKRARTFGDHLTNTSGLEVGSTTSKKRSKGKLRRLKGEVAHEIKKLPNDYEALSEEQYQDITEKQGPSFIVYFDGKSKLAIILQCMT